MKPAVESLISLSICLAAGACLFLLAFNRLIIGMTESRTKDAITGSTLLALTVVPAAAGWILGFSVWLILPGLFLASIAAGEIWRVCVRRKCHALGPIETRGFRVSLSQPLTTCDLAVMRYEIAAPQWLLPRLRVAHISDLHVSDKLPMDYYAMVMERVSESDPDLLLISGDFVARARFAPLLRGILPQARARCGAFAVLGNHDHWSGAAAIEDAIRQSGIVLLGNGSRRVGIGGGGSVVLCGCEDPWSPEPWRAPAPEPGGLLLGISHTPDNIDKFRAAGAFAVFAGHCHAGQIRVPRRGSIIVPSVYGRRFDHGHFQVGATHLFVTSGIGAYSPAFRVYCQPDIFIVDILAAMSSAPEGTPGNGRPEKV